MVWIGTKERTGPARLDGEIYLKLELVTDGKVTAKTENLTLLVPVEWKARFQFVE